MTKIVCLFAAVCALLLTACVGDVDKFFAEKRLNRLGILRDDIQPGTLIIHSNGVAKSTDHVLDVAPNATLPIRSFGAVLPSLTQNKTIDASVALQVIDAVLPLGLDGALKLSSNVKVSQTTAAGQRITETQMKTLLGSAEGAPLRSWILDRAKRRIPSFVVMETYRAKELTIVGETGKEVTTGLGVGQTKLLTKGEAKFKVTRTKKEELSISGDKFYVFAVAIAAFDVMGQAPNVSLGSLGVDLSQPVPKLPVLGAPGVAPGEFYKTVTLQPEF